MPVTFMPPKDNIRHNIFQMHGGNESRNETTSTSKDLYAPLKEEVRRIAKLIERFSEMEISEPLRKGEVKMNSVSREKAEGMFKKETLEVLEELNIKPFVREGLKKFILDLDFYPSSALGFTLSSTGKGYLINENIEDALLDEFALPIRLENSERMRIERFYVLAGFVHELVHQTVAENNPRVTNARLEATADIAKVISSVEGVENKDPEIIKKFFSQLSTEYAKIEDVQGEDSEIMRTLDSIRDRMFALTSYNEAVAYYTTRKVLGKLGLSHTSTRLLNFVKERNDLTTKGIVFLETIERKTGKNPISFTIHNPPWSMEEIEDSNKYLESVRERKV